VGRVPTQAVGLAARGRLGAGGEAPRRRPGGGGVAVGEQGAHRLVVGAHHPHPRGTGRRRRAVRARDQIGLRRGRIASRRPHAPVARAGTVLEGEEGGRVRRVGRGGDVACAGPQPPRRVDEGAGLAPAPLLQVGVLQPLERVRASRARAARRRPRALVAARHLRPHAELVVDVRRHVQRVLGARRDAVVGARRGEPARRRRRAVPGVDEVVGGAGVARAAVEQALRVAGGLGEERVRRRTRVV
jgi:hypothetical protein